MELRCDGWAEGAAIPERYAAGKPDVSSGKGGVTFSDNLNPPLAWRGAPAGTKSFALLCHDPDVPSRGEDVNQPDREVPAELPRVDFFHWVLVDLPATVGEIAEGEFSRGFTPRGKAGPAALHGARQGLNDYTNWFAGDPAMRGDYHGWDGPFPPFNDALVHRYLFTLYALDVERLDLPGRFDGDEARAALAGHVLAEAHWSGSYTLNPRLRGGGG